MCWDSPDLPELDREVKRGGALAVEEAVDGASEALGVSVDEEMPDGLVQGPEQRMPLEPGEVNRAGGLVQGLEKLSEGGDQRH